MAIGKIRDLGGARPLPYEIEILAYDSGYSRCVNPTVTDGVLTASIGGQLWGAGNHQIIQFSVSAESTITISSALTFSGAKYYITDSSGNVLYNTAAASTATLPADIITVYIYYPAASVNDLGQHGITVRKK